jgi:hypothetical protein
MSMYNVKLIIPICLQTLKFMPALKAWIICRYSGNRLKEDYRSIFYCLNTNWNKTYIAFYNLPTELFQVINAMKDSLAGRPVQSSFPKKPMRTSHFETSKTGNIVKATSITSVQSAMVILNVPKGACKNGR